MRLPPRSEKADSTRDALACCNSELMPFGKDQKMPRNLPPLEVGTTYRASDFEYFEYMSSRLTGQAAILRLHLKNGTIVELPTTEAELRRLQTVLNAAYPDTPAPPRFPGKD
jgi:hypothetical protein